MSLARVQFFSVSLDGFGTGEGQSLETPFGHAGERLHEWMFVTRWWNEMVGEPGGSRGIEDAFLRLHDRGVGAEIMGARKYGPPGWPDDPDWKGWWGPNPPFHTPVFVLTHHTRPPIEMEGGTTFHFIDASPAEALATAREAAGGLDVRIGGGATTIREFVAARLIDHMHIAVVPILLGRGERLWDGLEGLERDYTIEATTAPSGVTHLMFTRRGARPDSKRQIEDRDIPILPRHARRRHDRTSRHGRADPVRAVRAAAFIGVRATVAQGTVRWVPDPTSQVGVLPGAPVLVLYLDAGVRRHSQSPQRSSARAGEARQPSACAAWEAAHRRRNGFATSCGQAPR